jgi:hypothetical protein
MTTLRPSLLSENLVASMNASRDGWQILDQPEGESNRDLIYR